MTKRPHPARTARLVSTGAAASLTFGVVGALALTDATAAPKSSAAIVIEQIVGQTPPQKIGQTDGSVATTTQTSAMITVIRRVHYLQPVATVKPRARSAGSICRQPRGMLPPPISPATCWP